MAQESISQKLTDLFSLFKSGALSKEEYELLKSQIITDCENYDNNIEEKVILPLVEKKPLMDSKQRPESITEPQINESKMYSGGIPNDTCKKNNSKKNYIFMIVAFGLLVIVTVIFLLKNSVDGGNGMVKNSAISQETISNNSKSSENITDWNEQTATKIILDNLNNFPEWSNYANGETGAWHHEILSYKKVITSNNEYMVALTLSFNFNRDECFSCYGQVSYFEFDKSNKWNLSNKSIAFTTGGKGGTPPDKTYIVNIAKNNYGILIEQMVGSQGYETTTSSIYSPINKSLKCILNLITSTSDEGAGGQENYKGTLTMISEDKEYFPIELIETGTDSEGKTIDKKIRYEFKGQEYANISNIQPYGHPF